MGNLIPWLRQQATPDNPLDVASFSQSVLQQQRTEVQHLVVTGLDNSGSVYASGAIDQLEATLPKFIQDLQQDAAIRASVLAAFSAFTNADSWRLTAPLCPVMELVTPSLQATSSTPLCGRVIESINLIKARRALVQSVLNVDQRHAWLIEMTDGCPTDTARAGEAQRAIQEVAPEAGIEVYLFGLGDGADMRFLGSLAQPERPAEMLSSCRDFAALFRWITSSLRITSRSIAGAVTQIESLSGRTIPTE